MKIEIVKGEDNPVAEFFSSSTSTPETDATWEKLCCSGESWYSIAEKVKVLSQRLECERDELRELLRQTQELCHEYLDAKIKTERERIEAQDTVERLTEQGLDLLDENRSLRRGRNKTLKLGNKLADECERILGLGLHQNTLPRFKAALDAWRENN